jgi:hypothetical protein
MPWLVRGAAAAAVFAVAYALVFYSHKLPVPASASTAVFITGTSSGIGRHAALALACHGYLVFAGLRREADGASLLAEADRRGCAGNLRPVLLDVTVHSDVVAARDQVQADLEAMVGTAHPRTLGLLVTNAGVAAMGAWCDVGWAPWRPPCGEGWLCVEGTGDGGAPCTLVVRPATHASPSRPPPPPLPPGHHPPWLQPWLHCTRQAVWRVSPWRPFTTCST